MTDRKFETVYHLYDNYQNQISQKYNKFALFIKIGLFYEMYSFSGTKYSPHLYTTESKKLRKIADILNVSVIIRNKRNNEASIKNPLMLGFPIKSLDKYKAKLLEEKYSVIIIEEFDMKVGVKKAEIFEIICIHYEEDNIPKPSYVNMELVMKNMDTLKVK